MHRDSEAPEIRSAQLSDLEEVEALLRASALPIEGLLDQFPSSYFVAREGGGLAGVVGVERYGQDGLLRSLAVTSSLRGRSLGRALLKTALARASDDGLRGVFLLTTTAKEFFLRHGFAETDRAHAPEAVRASKEFASICPSSAACLVMRAE